MQLVDMSYEIIKQINEMLYIHEQSTILRTCRTMQEMVTNIHKKSEESCYVNVYMKENKVLVVPLSGCGSARQYKKTQHHWVQTEDVIAQLTKNKIKKFTFRKCNLTVEYCTMLSELIKIYPLKIDKCDVLSSILPNKSLSAFGNLLKTLQPRVININKLPNIGMAAHKIIPCLDEQRLEYISYFFWKYSSLTVSQCYFNERTVDRKFGHITCYSPWFAIAKYPEMYSWEMFRRHNVSTKIFLHEENRQRKTQRQNGFGIRMPFSVYMNMKVSQILWNDIKRVAKWANIKGRMDGDIVRLEGGGGRSVGWYGPVFEIMKIPASTIELVIAHHGSEIQNIQAHTRCLVQLSPESDPGSRVRSCILQGNRMSVDLAKQMINEVILRVEQQQVGEGVQQQQHNQGGGEDGRSITVERLIPTTKCGLIVGKQGDTIKQVQVAVPRSSVGMIIGKGGEIIKRLTQDSGTKIHIKVDEKLNDRCAVLTGTREQIYKATELILDIVHRSEGRTKDFISVPANQSELVIGKGGETIKQINTESQAFCDTFLALYPTTNQTIFIIKGTPYQIHHAKHIIKIKIGRRQPGTPVPPFAGPGGPNMGGQGGFGGAPGSQFGGGQYGGAPQMPNNQWNSNFN